MKSFISFIILLTTFTVGCMHTTFADFFDKENNIKMWHEMNHHDCHKSENQDCEDSNMECCKSPYFLAVIQNDQEDTSSNSHLQIDIDILSFQKELGKNKIHQLNSPPKYAKYIHCKNQYIQLVWNIKSNC